MAINSFSTLKTAIAEWVGQDDINNRLGDFIALAEAKLNRRLATRQMISTQSAALSTSTFALPSDFLHVDYLVVAASGGTYELQYLTPIQLNSAVGNLESGPPRYYTIVGSNVQVMPSPDSGSSYTYTLSYYAKLVPLSNGDPSNWLLALAPDVYLYGSLLEVEPYLHNDERLPTWKMLFEQGIQEVQGIDQRRQRPGARSIPNSPGRTI